MQAFLFTLVKILTMRQKCSNKTPSLRCARRVNSY